MRCHGTWDPYVCIIHFRFNEAKYLAVLCTCVTTYPWLAKPAPLLIWLLKHHPCLHDVCRGAASNPSPQTEYLSAKYAFINMIFAIAHSKMSFGQHTELWRLLFQCQDRDGCNVLIILSSCVSYGKLIWYMM